MTTVKKFSHTALNYEPVVPDDPVSHLDAIDAALTANALIPGEVVFSFDDAVPSGTLDCDGSAVSRTTYSNLFDVIGEMYGNGDGSTTFNLPNLKGWHIAAWGYTWGYDHVSRLDRGDGVTGMRVGTYQNTWMGSHRHSIHYNTNNTAGASGNIVRRAGSGHNIASYGGNETRPDNKYVYMCIAY